MIKSGYTITVDTESGSATLSVVSSYPTVAEAIAAAKALVGGSSAAAEQSAPAKRGRPPKSGKASNGAKAAPPDDEDEEDEEDEEEDEDEDEDDEDDEDEDEDEDEEPAAGGKGKTLQITNELKNATKLREVIMALMKQGIKSKKDLTAACIKLQPKLKVLQPIQDLQTRVPRAVELVNPNAK